MKPLWSTTLTNADGSGLSVKGITIAPVFEWFEHTSQLRVDNFSAPMIVGCSFLFKHGMTLDLRMAIMAEEFDSQNKCLSILILEDHIPQAVCVLFIEGLTSESSCRYAL